MADTLTYKIINAHLVEGAPTPGETIALRIDQTLTQDATGTAAYLQLEVMNLDRVRTELSVSYVDHNTLQSGPMNADDHAFLRSIAARYGIVFSRPGNGICHQVHLECFGVPGKTLLGSDSHTPTGGGLGMLAIGAGGQDVACAMAGMPFYVTAPQVVGVRLTGQLAPWVAAKDVILEVLRRMSVKGGVGKVIEYTGPGVASLSVPERATITNMGAELGATTSIFPSDDVTAEWLRSQGREGDFTPLAADADAVYDELIELDLAALEPLIAQPHMPDLVVPVAELAGMPVQQVCIGSCTNSSYYDLALTGAMLKGKRVVDGMSLTVSPGSRQVLKMIAASGALADIVAAGGRILECACGPCIGMGLSPQSGAVSLRTFNRNFEGRSGTPDAGIFLCSPAVAVAAALTGVITDPRTLGEQPDVPAPPACLRDDAGIIMPPADGTDIEIVRGPNIKPIPRCDALADTLTGTVLLKVEDNITTDHIMPAGAKILPLRSNIPALSMHVFEQVDPTFPQRALTAGGGFIVGGENYGQGSSREHAALAPMFLGIKAVIVKSFARMHKANLINFGILPLTFADPADYDRIAQTDTLSLAETPAGVDAGTLTLRNETQDITFQVLCEVSAREKEILKAGGKLNMI